MCEQDSGYNEITQKAGTIKAERKDATRPKWTSMLSQRNKKVSTTGGRVVVIAVSSSHHHQLISPSTHHAPNPL
jgi:hypothetical protein